MYLRVMPKGGIDIRAKDADCPCSVLASATAVDTAAPCGKAGSLDRGGLGDTDETSAILQLLQQRRFYTTFLVELGPT